MRLAPNRKIIVALLAIVLVFADRADAQIDGLFTALWTFPGTYNPYYTHHGQSTDIANVERWKLEIRDMDRAGFDFVAPYSQGLQPPQIVLPEGDGINFGAFASAIQQLGSPLRMAYFHDSSGDWARAGGVPYDLAVGGALPAARINDWKAKIYTANTKRWFDTVPVAQQYRPNGSPVLFFYGASSAFYSNREFLGDLLEQIRLWFINDYGVSPYILVEVSWTQNVSEATRNKIYANSSGVFNWAIPPGFPGGGVVLQHPHSGITIGTAGVGYKEPYVPCPGTPGCRYRDRANGATLASDWNSIKNATLRMVAAWIDNEEDSGISRTVEYGYQYIDQVNSLIYPSPILSQVVPGSARTGVPQWLSIRGNGFRPGALLRYSPDGVTVYSASTNYVSPQELQIFFDGAAPPGSYFVDVFNPNGVASNYTTFTVTP